MGVKIEAQVYLGVHGNGFLHIDSADASGLKSMLAEMIATFPGLKGMDDLSATKVDPNESKREIIIGYVRGQQQSKRSGGYEPCVWLFSQFGDFKVATVYNERLGELPFDTTKGAGVNDNQPPKKENALRANVFIKCDMEIEMQVARDYEGNVKVNDKNNKPMYEFNRIVKVTSAGPYALVAGTTSQPVPAGTDNGDHAPRKSDKTVTQKVTPIATSHKEDVGFYDNEEVPAKQEKPSGQCPECFAPEGKPHAKSCKRGAKTVAQETVAKPDDDDNGINAIIWMAHNPEAEIAKGTMELISRAAIDVKNGATVPMSLIGKTGKAPGMYQYLCGMIDAIARDEGIEMWNGVKPHTALLSLLAGRPVSSANPMPMAFRWLIDELLQNIKGEPNPKYNEATYDQVVDALGDIQTVSEGIS